MANKKPKKTVKSGIPKLDRYIRPEKEMLYASYAQASNYFSLPYYSMVKLAKEAGANIRIKKNVVIDLELIDKYLENNCEGAEGEN